MAAVVAPARVSAKHQSLLHLVGQAAWSDEAVLWRTHREFRRASGDLRIRRARRSGSGLSRDHVLAITIILRIGQHSFRPSIRHTCNETGSAIRFLRSIPSLLGSGGGRDGGSASARVLHQALDRPADALVRAMGHHRTAGAGSGSSRTPLIHPAPFRAPRILLVVIGRRSNRLLQVLAPTAQRWAEPDCRTPRHGLLRSRSIRLST